MTEENITTVYVPSAESQLSHKLTTAVGNFAAKVDQNIRDMVRLDFGNLRYLEPFIADLSAYRRAKADRRQRLINLVCEDVQQQLSDLLAQSDD